MHALDGVVRNYAWGSHLVLAGLRGLPLPSVEPEAELWFGAHPSGPSQVAVGDSAVALDELISTDPVSMLGKGVTKGGRLPYLVKLLAIARPLSLQVHPSAEQARAGFDLEDAAGIPLDSALRRYKDPFAKPELLVALEPVRAFVGFRQPTKTLELLNAINVPELSAFRDWLSRRPDSRGLAAVVSNLLRVPAATAARLVDAVAGRCAEYLSDDRIFAHKAELADILMLAQAYPRDIGVICALLLNHVTVQSGEGLYIGAGQLHCYLSGTALEVMANSDNVLRGGLTEKRVDVEGLSEIVDFHPVEPQLVRPSAGPSGEREYRTPAREFRLSLTFVDASGIVLSGHGPRILVCTGGSVQVQCARHALALRAGSAVFIPSSTGLVSVVSDSAGAELFAVSIPNRRESGRWRSRASDRIRTRNSVGIRGIS